MNYLVMETHPAYAVLLDEKGRFLKAANLRYQVGDVVQEIVEIQMPQRKVIPIWKPLSGLIAAAACFCLVFFGYYQPNFTAYGTLRIQINPDVEMTVSRTDRVLDLEGLNADGEDLIEGYSYRGKDRETAANELVERAIDMGYLSDGDTISITVSSSDAEWQAREEAQVREQLEARYGETIIIRLGSDSDSESTPPQTDPSEIVIPVSPPTSPPESDDTGHGLNGGGAADHTDTDYGPNADGVTDYTETDYGPNADGVTDYADTDYGPNADGVTDYTDTDYGPNADGVTDYADTDYGPNADGVTDYSDTDYGPNADGVTDYTDTDDGPYSGGITDYEDRDDGGDEDDGDDDYDDDDD